MDGLQTKLNIMAKAYVYDYETVYNVFLAVFINVQNPNEIISYEVSTSRNQYEDYILFMKKCIKEKTLMISYNGLKFDSQISLWLLNNYKTFSAGSTGEAVAHATYLVAQDVIKRSNAKEFPIYHPKDNPFRECDILAINNYDNSAKRCSLKWLQYSMDWHNVEDMSTKHDAFHNEKDILQLKSYCINDCQLFCGL